MVIGFLINPFGSLYIDSQNCNNTTTFIYEHIEGETNCISIINMIQDAVIMYLTNKVTPNIMD